MNLLTLTSFFLIILGAFKILEISPIDFINDIFDSIENKDDSISKKIKIVTQGQNDRWLVSLIKETKMILEYTNKTEKFSNICIGAVISMILGIYLAVLIKNYFLVPVLAISFLTLPFQYIKLTSVEYKKSLSQELEVSLSIITSSYMRNENIIEAIRENIEQIKPPVKNVFEEFLLETEYINSDISKSLSQLRNKVNDEIFIEWIDMLIACQENITLKNNLNTIVSKLSSLRVLSAEINNNMYAPLKEFASMLLLVYGNIPLLYILNKEWYKTLMFTVPGKMVLVVVVVVTFISFTGIMKLTRPIDPSILEEGK